jgi:hypothetical protein
MLALAGCAAPVMHPRTADVLDAHRLRLRGNTVLVAIAPSTAVLQSGDETMTDSGEYSDLWTARQLRTRWPIVDAVTGVLFSFELQAAYSLFDGCEGGARLGFVRIGAELRCAVLDEDWGAPLSAALSVGAAQQLGYFLVGGRVRNGSYNTAPRGSELRAGLDLSKRLSGVTPLLNINLGYVRQVRDIVSGLPSFEGHHFSEAGNIFVERDELRLSLPVGLAFEYEPHSAHDQRTRVMLGVVPELTLQAWERFSAYQEVDGSVVADFEQHWALYLTLAAETEL